jgi:NAD(P)-dependent dehydrogenase (short-subunit alcohol dehydrogenase family)
MTVLDHLKVWSCPLKSGQAIKLGWQAYEPAVVVTGASEGIGRAFAELLTDKEFTPLLISRDAGALNSLAAELSGRRRGTKRLVERFRLPRHSFSALPDHEVNSPMRKLFSTADVHQRDRFDYWHEVACKNLVEHTARPLCRSTFDAKLEEGSLADIGLVMFENSPMDVSHTLQHVSHSQNDDLF